MKLKNLLLISALTIAIVLTGCGKNEENPGTLVTLTETPSVTPTKDEPTPTESPDPEPTKGEDIPEETLKDKAVAAYMKLLKAAPGIDMNSDELFTLSMDYAANLVKYGEHYDTYAIYDINGDDIPELIAVTTINFKWSQVYVFTYADGKPVLLNDPLNPMSHGTFDQNATVNGLYTLVICSDNHIHNVWKGMTPIGEVEEVYAYELEGTELKYVDCSAAETKVPYGDIAKVNEFRREITDEPDEPVAGRNVKINFYKVPELYSSVLSADDIRAFNLFVEAWLNYDPKVEIDHPRNQGNLWGMIQECFFLAYGDFDEEKGFTYDDKYVYFPYVTTSKAEHDAIIDAFEKRVNSFYAGISDDEEGVELARHIYINYNNTIAYDHDAAVPGNANFANSSGYTAMMYGSGVCMSFAKAYSYLLRQVGIEAFTVSGLSGTPDIDSHEWSALKVGDKYYFADPTWDYISTPQNYMYFCFGLNKREENGYPEDLMHICENGDIPMKKYVKIEREDME